MGGVGRLCCTSPSGRPSVTGAGDQTPYTSNTKNNDFDYNIYTVANLSDSVWFWVSSKD